MITESRWFINLARYQNSGCSMSKLLQNSGTRLPQLMNTSGFHQNVGIGNKLFNAMSPNPLLSEVFGKGSGCARLPVSYDARAIHFDYALEELFSTDEKETFA